MIRTTALRRLGVGPVDLQVEAGTCVSLAGPSGAGKSVLLRMIADLDPHEGDALLDGRACSATPAPQWRRLVTYVAAEPGWWEPTVEGHFPAGADLAPRLAQVGIAADAAGWPVERLSTGERQRIALLRAITPKVRVLLLDEPTSGLDAASVALVENLLRGAMARGVAILMVTHDPAQAARMASRRLQLREGRVIEAGAGP